MKIKISFKEGVNGTTSNPNYWAKLERQQDVMGRRTPSYLHQLLPLLKYMLICIFDPIFPHSCLLNLH